MCAKAAVARQKTRQENSAATNDLSKRVKIRTNSCGASSTQSSTVAAVPAMEDLHHCNTYGVFE